MLKTKIQAVVASMLVIPPVAPETDYTAPGFLYGTANEINLKGDNQTVFPVICFFPIQPVTVGLTHSGSADNWYNMYFEILYKTKFEKDSNDNEPLQNSALAIANRFLFALREYRETQISPRFFKWDDKEQARAQPIYNAYDVNTTGISLTFRIKTRLNDYILPC